MNYFVITGRLPGLNEMIAKNRSGWASGAKLKEETDTRICWAIRRHMTSGICKKVTAPVRIRFEWHESNRRRDLDNIFSGKKFILDAMQRMGVLLGDDQKHVTGLRDEFILDKDNFVLVIIEERGKEDAHYDTTGAAGDPETADSEATDVQSLRSGNEALSR